MLIRSREGRAAWGCAAALLVWAGLSTVLAWGTAGLVAGLRSPGPAPFDTLIAVAAAIAAWTCLTWLAAALALSVLSGLPAYAEGRFARLRDATAPWVIRRLAAAILGFSISVPIGAALAGPAAAAAAPIRVASTAGKLSAGLLAAPSLDRPGSAPALDRPLAVDVSESAGHVLPDRTPDRPGAAQRAQRAADSLPLVTSRPHSRHHSTDTIAVRRGDTLWDIAARSLRSADPLDVAREWRKWYDANRVVIGPDPGLLVPGTLLVRPIQAA